MDPKETNSLVFRHILEFQPSVIRSARAGEIREINQSVCVPRHATF